MINVIHTVNLMFLIDVIHSVFMKMLAENPLKLWSSLFPSATDTEAVM